MRKGDAARVGSVACVGERKAAAGVSGGRRALVAGCVEGRGAAMPPVGVAGRGAAMPPVGGVRLPVRGGKVEPKGGLAAPNPDWPSPD